MIKFLTRRSIEWNKKLIVCLYDIEQTTANNNVGMYLLMYRMMWCGLLQHFQNGRYQFNLTQILIPTWSKMDV